MKILEINYVNFRNLQDSILKFGSGINLITGKNGQGKTSILEAIYFGATGKSFRTIRNNELIQYNKTKVGTSIIYKDKINEKQVVVKISSKGKEYQFNQKKVSHDIFFGQLNVITFIPEDINIVVGSPIERRSFFNNEIAQANNEYFHDLKKYMKILKIRNKYLKEKKHKEPLFKVYEEQFIKLSARIMKKREEFSKNLSIILNLNYRKLFDNTKELSLKYITEIGEIKNLDLESIEEKIKKYIEKVFYLEVKSGYSLVGPQKDDFIFLLNGRYAKSFSSQGEKKSIIFSLKLSEIDMIIKEKKEKPILLLDDISSYFDSIRKENILNYLKKRKIQVFISSTENLEIEAKNFVIEKGEIKTNDNQY
jgi:DNA replication and repair protein RecF